MTPERIEELADGCFGDRSNEVSQGVIVKAIRTAVNEALEEAAKIADRTGQREPTRQEIAYNIRQLKTTA